MYIDWQIYFNALNYIERFPKYVPRLVNLYNDHGQLVYLKRAIVHETHSSHTHSITFMILADLVFQSLIHILVRNMYVHEVYVGQPTDGHTQPSVPISC